MKKTLLFTVPALVLSGTVMAQNNAKAPVFKDSNVTKVVAKVSKHAVDAGFNAAGSVIAPQQRLFTSTLVGTSTYQLQTNYSVQNRIVANADGTISAGYTFSNTGAWSDRGTGYVYHDGTAWSPSPAARIEPVRTGWPSVMVLGNNSEVVIAHSSTNLHMASRPVKGTGTWNSSTAINSTAPYGSTWPRAVAGGADGNTIHMIVISNPTDGASTPVYWNGQQGSLTYSRSQDGGATWDKLHEVPTQHDSTQYNGFTADAYAIDARGNVIAYVVGGPLNDLFLMKSLDNGTTWTKTIIQPFAIPFFVDQLSDTTGDGVADTLRANDGSVALLIDNNDDVHVMFGRMRVMNDDTTDGLYSYFPGTSGIMYWNENMAAPTQIADLEDTDSDGFINISANGWGTYQNSLTSFPYMAIDATGRIHATFSGLVENTDPLGNGKAARNLYYFSSSDNGMTWSNPYRVDPNEIQEQVWCSLARNAEDDCIKMIYHVDEAPGHGTTSTNPDFTDNSGVTAEVMYACLNPLVGIAETVKLSEMVNLYPNPANTAFTVNTISNITRIELFNSLGEMVGSYTPNATSANIDVTGLSSGLYVVNVYNGDRKIGKTLIKD